MFILKIISHTTGLSVSYDMILQTENQLATVCQFTEEIGLVCPSQMRPGDFTVGALDNLDHNKLGAQNIYLMELRQNI